MEGAEYKAKGGARIMIIDAQGAKHAIKENAIHINQMEPTDLRIDPADLEMAWELCAETEKSTFSPKSIVSLIDDSMFKSSVDVYKAFRLLTSDLGKLFFKPINDHEYKAKALNAVQASKDAWCRDHTEADYCFV